MTPGNNGQIQKIHYYSAPGTEDLTKSENFSYDPWSRLATAGTGDNATWGLSWNYDRFGNRLQQNVTAGSAPAPSVSVDPATNRVNSSGYAYDAAGNITNDTVHTYTYDAMNWLTQVDGGATATYTYLGALRVKKVAGATNTVYVYSGTKPIAEYVGGTLSNEYIYAGSGMLATVAAGGAVTYEHPDHLSIRAESDASGNLIRSTGHFPFGEAWYDTSPGSKWQFTTYERDSESALDYADFRFYSSRVGRFMSADLLGGRKSNPASLDLYTYVLNDATDLSDPTGLDPFLGCLLNDVGNCVPGTTFRFGFGFDVGNINACAGDGYVAYFCAATHGGTDEFLGFVKGHGVRDPIAEGLDPISEMYDQYVRGINCFLYCPLFNHYEIKGTNLIEVIPIPFPAFNGPIISERPTSRIEVPETQPSTEVPQTQPPNVPR